MSLIKSAIQDALKSEGEELEALPWIKLVLKLHPVYKEKKWTSTNFKKVTSVSHSRTDTVRLMTHGLYSTGTHLHLPMSLPLAQFRGATLKLPFWKMTRLYF